MNHLKPAIAVIAMTIFLGCATAKIESNVRSGFNKKIDRLYALGTPASGSSSKKFIETLNKELSVRFEQRGIVCKFHIFNDLALDEKSAIKSEVESFNPNFILMVSQTSKQSTGGVDSGAEFELTMFEKGSEVPFWKANLSTGSNLRSANGMPLSTSIGDAELTADKVIETLAKDGLVGPIRATPPSK